MQQIINHIDHVVWVCKPENLEKYAEQFRTLFKIKFDGPYERDGWIRVYVSWDSGIELATPLDPDSIPGKHLKEKGEGPWAMVFGVDNLDEACAHAKSLGYEPSEVMEQNGDEPWSYRMEACDEAFIGDILGTSMVYGRIVRKPGVVESR